MADTLVLGASAHACGFKSRRLHQEKGVAFWLLPFLIAGGALRFLFRLVLPAAKLQVLTEVHNQFNRTTSSRS